MSQAQGKVAIVTGAARGIGAGIARQLATDGFDISLADLPSQKENLETLHQEIVGMGRKALIQLTDVTQEDEVKTLINVTVDTLGGLDVMVANAGIARIAPLTICSTELWDEIFAINTRAVFLCYKYAAEVMIKQGRGGRIIGASSVAGKQGVAYAPAYAASKFAVCGLTQSAAKELGKFGITVNTYAAGPVDTPLLQGPNVNGNDLELEALKESEIQRTAVGRLGTPEDIAHMVSYLASEKSGFVTGQSISINGGQYFD